ncbi:MAG: outer membrane protein [Ahrensia sp.]
MRSSLKILLATTVAATSLTGAAQAADMAIPQVIEAPSYVAPVHKPAAANSGWYLRGDLGYSFNKFEDADYITYGTNAQNADGLLRGDLDDSFLIGGGVGFQATDYFRADLTLDYTAEADFLGYTEGTCTRGGVAEACQSEDKSTYSALAVMANAYVDLGTYGRITPYVGAGIGGANVEWGSLENCISGGTDQDGCVTHDGHKEMRFAYQLHAGASIDVTCNTAVDLGYTYREIQGGGMFKYAEFNGFGTGPGFDNGIKSHQLKAGLRYKFGANECKPKQEMVHYQPTPMPSHPVYK